MRIRWWRGTAVAAIVVATALVAAGCKPASPEGSAPTASSHPAPAGNGTPSTTGPSSSGPSTTGPSTTGPSSSGPSSTAPSTPPRSSSPGSASPSATATPSASNGTTPLASLSGPIVALGDSYTSGDLLPLSLDSPPAGCLRSPSAYPALVASALHDTSGLVDASCTSAGVADMTGPEHTATGTNPPQLDSLAPGDALVMLTLGGDDLGFLNVLSTCMELSWSAPAGNPCQRHYTSGGTDQLAALVTAEAPKMAAALSQIRARAPKARVLLVGYPDLFPVRGGCWPAVPIAEGDISYLRGIELKLNAILAADAVAAGATFVDTYDPTLGHDFCANGSAKDIEGLLPGSLAAPFHPNARGQAAIAAQILKAL
jgi:lysophospholipase L1-like esterase